MLERLSENSTAYFIRRGIVPEEKRAIYAYGFAVTYSTVFGLGAILLLGALFHRTPETLVFLGYFIAIRLFAGGYHAPTYGGCFLVTLCAYGGECLMAQGLLRMLKETSETQVSGLEGCLAFSPGIVLWLLFLGNIIYIWKKAPVPNPHRSMGEERREKNRRRARTALLFSAACMAVCQIGGYLWIMSETVSTMTVISVMIAITKEGGNV